MKLGFIGTGNLASSIVRGVASAGKIPTDEILIFDVNSEKTEALKAQLGVRTAHSAKEVAAQCENVVIAVKPKDFAALARDISSEVVANNPLVISTAAGTEISSIISYFSFLTSEIRAPLFSSIILSKSSRNWIKPYSNGLVRNCITSSFICLKIINSSPYNPFLYIS